jgi:hypothetical protein
MAFTPASPIVGAAMTSLTSPTYTPTLDVAPTFNGKQWIFNTLGGTQTGVTAHSINNPFQLAVYRPYAFSALPLLNAQGQFAKKVPRNVYKYIVRKGATPLVNTPADVIVVTLTVDVPAGVDQNDPKQVAAALSCMCGVMWDQATNIYGNSTNGTL